MIRHLKLVINLFCVVVLARTVAAGTLPADWKHDQPFEAGTNGLIKISLPVQTLDAARSSLEDIRLYNDAGKEIPYLIERPRPVPKVVMPARSFKPSLAVDNTVILLESDLRQPIEAVTLETPAREFIKAVTIESSNDRTNWQVVAQGQPIFRQSFGASHLRLSFSPLAARFFRLTISDRRSSPIPFTGALIHAAIGESTVLESLAAEITERDENGGQARLSVNLGAANVDVAAIQLETAEPLFTREITIAMPQISENSIHEQVIGQGTIFRVAVDGQTPAENLRLPVEATVRSRELLLFINNGDNPSLPITGIRIERHPIYLIFLAHEKGRYHLLTGNPHCPAPKYDLAALGMNLRNIAIYPAPIPLPSDNPNYQAPEVIPGIDVSGAPLDISQWKFRKPLKISSSGAQQVEFDLDLMAHAARDFSDVRVELGSNQVPYITERTSISRAIALTVTPANDAKTPRLSRWYLKLPQAGLPLTSLTFTSPNTLFDRTFLLYEEVADQRGEKYRHPLGNGSWRQIPGHVLQEFSIPLEIAPQGDALFLETDNGDNPAIALEKFQVFRPVTRIRFKAKTGDPLFLYYGNPQVSGPHYDLSLVADQLLSAEKKSVLPGNEEQLKQSAWQEKPTVGQDGVLFWGILAVVVIVLLVVISRLLPKTAPPPA